MGTYLGYSIYVLFAFTDHTKYTSTAVLIFYHSYAVEEGEKGLHIFLGWRQQQVVLEYTRPQSYNKTPVQIYDLGQWWDLMLRGTAVSMQR